MKLILFVPPLAALIAGGVWLANLAATQNSLARDNSELRERISAAKPSASPDDMPSPAAQRDRPRNGKPAAKALNEWKTLAEGMLYNSGWQDDPRLQLRLTTRLAKMSVEEMLATSDEITAADLSPECIVWLRQQFFDAAAEKNPELALRHFEGLLDGGNPSMRSSLITAFRKWFHEDPGTATVWFDEMIAAGKFKTKRLDGKNEIIAYFMAPVIESQLATDPAAALSRLKSLPEELRLDSLEWNYRTLTPEMATAYGELLRQGLPEELHNQGLSRLTSSMVLDQGFVKTGEFLDRIDATPAERQALAAEVAYNGLVGLAGRSRQMVPQAVTVMREWLVRQDPQQAERITGEALAKIVGSVDFKETAEMISRLHAETGSDDLLAGFLGSLSGDAEAAMAMTEQIKDAALREEIQTHLSDLK